MQTFPSLLAVMQIAMFDANVGGKFALTQNRIQLQNLKMSAIR